MDTKQTQGIGERNCLGSEAKNSDSKGSYKESKHLAVGRGNECIGCLFGEGSSGGFGSSDGGADNCDCSS